MPRSEQQPNTSESQQPEQESELSRIREYLKDEENKGNLHVVGELDVSYFDGDDDYFPETDIYVASLSSLTDVASLKHFTQELAGNIGSILGRRTVDTSEKYLPAFGDSKVKVMVPKREDDWTVETGAIIVSDEVAKRTVTSIESTQTRMLANDIKLPDQQRDGERVNERTWGIYRQVRIYPYPDRASAELTYKVKNGKRVSQTDLEQHVYTRPNFSGNPVRMPVEEKLEIKQA